MSDMFPEAPVFPPSLADEELRLLAELPVYDSVQEIEQGDEATARRLENAGLIKVHRWKDDPIASRATMYAGKLPVAGLRATSPSDPLAGDERG